MKARLSKYPKWLLDPENPEIIQSLRNIFNEVKLYAGKTFKELEETVEELNRDERKEELRRLRLEAAEFLTESSEVELPNFISPSDIRQYVFSAVWQRGSGFITTHESLFQPTSADIFIDAGKYFNITPEQIENNLYADTPEERLVVLKTIDGEFQFKEIICTINFIRLKKILRKAARMTIQLPSRFSALSPYVKIFWLLKRNHLMYDINEAEGAFLLNVTGPYTLFTKSTIYGNRFADFIQSFLRLDLSDWKIIVELISGQFKKVEILTFDNSIQKYFVSKEKEIQTKEFKSGDEEAFQKYFTRATDNWVLEYEARIVRLEQPQGEYVGLMIPDFIARHVQTGREVIIEIVGYWREEYLKRKIQKIRLIKDKGVFVVVNKILSIGTMQEDDLKNDGVKLFYYSNRSELKRVSTEIIELLDLGE